MAWVNKPHKCPLPFLCHKSVAKVGAHFECDYCKVTWRVQAIVLGNAEDNTYKLTFTRRVGDYVYTRSWQDED